MTSAAHPVQMVGKSMCNNGRILNNKIKRSRFITVFNRSKEIVKFNTKSFEILKLAPIEDRLRY